MTFRSISTNHIANRTIRAGTRIAGVLAAGAIAIPGFHCHKPAEEPKRTPEPAAGACRCQVPAGDLPDIKTSQGFGLTFTDTEGHSAVISTILIVNANGSREGYTKRTLEGGVIELEVVTYAGNGSCAETKRFFGAPAEKKWAAARQRLAQDNIAQGQDKEVIGVK